MALSREGVAAPLTAAALVAVQVGSNAARDGLFLSWFPVTSLPYFIGAAALLAVAAAQASGRLLSRLGPARVAPALCALSTVLFLAERALLDGTPRLATVLVYLHSTVLGAIVISAFWSLLNERFDPHSAKPLMARVAGAAAFGGLLGGLGAERVGALGSPAALLLMLGAAVALGVPGAVALGAAMPVRPRQEDPSAGGGAWTEIRRVDLLRHLALVTLTAAVLAALVDYTLKADAVAHLGRGGHLVRFFGLFYATTSLAAFVVQAALGRRVLGWLGLGGAVASHPVAVGAAGVLGFFLPAPWRSLLPRGLDVSLRASVFRTGYELLYTPLPAAAKRSAKSTIDVVADCAGKAAGAVLILLLTRLDPRYAFAAVSLAALAVAAGELGVARRLRADYVGALQGGLVRQGEDLEQAADLSLSDFTAVGSLAGLDRTAVMRALKAADRPGAAGADPVLAAVADLRSGDVVRIRAALHQHPADPLVAGALISLLARRDTLRPVVGALAAFGPRAAGQLVDALLDPATPETVRRRLPLVLKSCASARACDGLVESLAAPSFEVRLRCARALLSLTDDHPELAVPPATVLAALERELAGPGDDPAFREHVFNLLALALEREPARIAARAFDAGDAYVRGTALEYLETVLPAPLFAALKPRLAGADAAAPRRRAAAEIRTDLLEAGHTMRLSGEDVRRRLAAAGDDEA